MKFNGIVGDLGSGRDNRVYTELRIRYTGDVERLIDGYKDKGMVENIIYEEKGGEKFVSFKVMRDGVKGIVGFDKGSDAGRDAFNGVIGKGGSEVVEENKRGVILIESKGKEDDGKELVNGFGLLI